MSDWRFDVEDLDEDGAGPERPEPGSPSLENVAFFLLGVAFAVAVFAALVL